MLRLLVYTVVDPFARLLLQTVCFSPPKIALRNRTLREVVQRYVSNLFLVDLNGHPAEVQ